MFILSKSDDSWKREIKDTLNVQRRKVKLIKTSNVMQYAKEYTFFTLAPLYVHAGISYSMPDQFEHEAGTSVDRFVIDYQQTIIGGLGRWGQFIEAMAHEPWEVFFKYMATAAFASFEKKKVWFTRWHVLKVAEASDSNIITSSADTIRLFVFLPDGNAGRMHASGGLPAKLWWEDPHHKIVEGANKILNVRGNLQ